MSEPPSTQPAAGHHVGRVLPLALPVALLAASVVAALAIRESVQDQADRLLRERTREVELVLDNAIASIPASLQALGVAARLGDPPERAFLAVARRTPGAGGQPLPTALVRVAGGTPVVAASAGGAPARGERLVGARADAIRRSLADPGLKATEVFRDGDRRLVAFALGPPTSPPETAILLDTPVQPDAAEVSGDDAFHELRAVVYATPDPRPDQIVVATTDETLRGDDVARGSVEVGDRRWLLLTSPRESLTGRFANASPWIVLAAGLIGSALFAAVILALLRRRDYALALVDQRTAELRRSLAALEEAQAQLVLGERRAAVGRVAAAVSHELRTPLGALTSALYAVREGVDGARSAAERAEVRRRLDDAEREVAAAARISESLLDFANEREPATASVDLAELLDEALSVAPSPDGVRLRRDLPELPHVRADRRQLRQVLLNLLSNAYEAMDDGGELTITARRVGRAVVLRVADTGRGMEPETASRMFDPFFTTKSAGIGLGLPVARRIIEMHGGSIAAHDAPGGGTELVLTVPVMPRDAP